MQQTDNTVVTFIYLPAPPENGASSEAYLNNLEVLSRDLPPTIFVHGISTVISTTL